MTTMNGTVVPGILPLLVLRHPSPSDNVFPDFNPISCETIYPGLSNMLSANVNMRGILSSRFSCSPESGENILHQIIEGDGRTHEAKYTCLVSSFEQAEDNETSSPAILSYVTGGNRNNDVKYKATKMTKGILLAAIQIFDKNYGGSSDTTITSMFQKYVQTLTANIPTSNEQNALAEFIRSFMLDRIKQNPESYWGGQDCLSVVHRRSLHGAVSWRVLHVQARGGGDGSDAAAGARLEWCQGLCPESWPAGPEAVSTRAESA